MATETFINHFALFHARLTSLEFYFKPGSKSNVDFILGIRSNGPVKFRELFEMLKFFFENEDNDYPQAWRRGPLDACRCHKRLQKWHVAGGDRSELQASTN